MGKTVKMAARAHQDRQASKDQRVKLVQMVMTVDPVQLGLQELKAQTDYLGKKVIQGTKVTLEIKVQKGILVTKDRKDQKAILEEAVMKGQRDLQDHQARLHRLHHHHPQDQLGRLDHLGHQVQKDKRVFFFVFILGEMSSFSLPVMCTIKCLALMI